MNRASGKSFSISPPPIWGKPPGRPQAWRQAARLFLLLLAVAIAPAAPKTFTILTLGDSITAGSKDFTCYRPLLAAKLEAAGFHVRFVGTRHTVGEPGAMLHEGYSGKPVEYLAENIDRLYRQNPADIVLLHAGHNHFDSEKPIPGILAATEKIIATLRAVNPEVKILLAQVIPAGKLPKYSYIPELNQELARLAPRLHVVLVDQATGFDYNTGTIADQVHPNAAGAEKMAARWYAALTPLLTAR